MDVTSSQQFYRIIKEAYGFQEPSIAKHYVEEIGNWLFFECHLLDFHLKITVPTRKDMAQLVLIVNGRHPSEFRSAAPNLTEIYAYALARLDKQAPGVQDHLRYRFGLVLDACKEWAQTLWEQHVEFCVKSWAAASPSV